MSPRATPDGYDGIPYEDLDFVEVDWSWAEENQHSPEYRSARGGGDDVLTEHATQAVLDPLKWIYDSESKTGAVIEVLGWSEGSGRYLRVLLVGADQPVDGTWIGLTAWCASRAFVRRMRREWNGQQGHVD